MSRSRGRFGPGKQIFREQTYRPKPFRSLSQRISLTRTVDGATPLNSYRKFTAEISGIFRGQPNNIRRELSLRE